MTALAFAVGCSQAATATEGIDGDAPPDGVDAVPPRAAPVLEQSRELCKLLSNRNTTDPTPNNVQFRSNVLGADLGIPVDHDGHTFVFFGDTIGFAGIWGNQSHPDSIGYATDASDIVAAHPESLCTRLGIVSLAPGSSYGPTVDSRVQADFAGGAMAAPTGHQLSEYIHNPAGSGSNRFAYLPGDFEVPSGAFSYGGSIYLFYTTVVSTSDVTMKGSYLARWVTPSTTGIPGYQILYTVDERFDASGPLHGDFINVSAEVSGDYVYLFGTGVYRASPVRLARKLLTTLATPGGFELYDAATMTWSPTKRGAPVIDVAGYGETSARYFANVDRWMFLGEEAFGGANRIVARFADHPEGPWGAGIAVHDMADTGFRATYCCTPDDSCTTPEFMNCDRTGFYGSYLMPSATTDGDRFTVAYTMSSFDPYNVALFSATFKAN